MNLKKVPITAIRRLSIYTRMLAGFEADGRQKVSSSDLGMTAGIPSTQVRKDLAYFGQFGKRGSGYSVKELKFRLKKILGVDRPWSVALVGAGNLGSALFSYPGFREQGFNIVAVFDNSPGKVNTLWKGIRIQNTKELSKTVREKNISIGIVAVPASGAQEVADEMCKAGIKAVLNFAPRSLKVPQGCMQANVDLAIELENLSYFLSKLR